MRAVGQYDAFARINSRGLRDREIDPARAKGKLRVLCLGDSFTWGQGVGDDETCPNVLERELAGAEAINAGVSAWGTAQELLWLEREGFGYSPDVVTIGFYPMTLRTTRATACSATAVPRRRASRRAPGGRGEGASGVPAVRIPLECRRSPDRGAPPLAAPRRRSRHWASVIRAGVLRYPRLD